MDNVYIETLCGLLSFLRDNDAPSPYRAVVEKSILLAEISVLCDGETDGQKTNYLVLDDSNYAHEFATMEEVETFMREELEEYYSKSGKFTIYEFMSKREVMATVKSVLELEEK